MVPFTVLKVVFMFGIAPLPVPVVEIKIVFKVVKDTLDQNCPGQPDGLRSLSIDFIGFIGFVDFRRLDLLYPPGCCFRDLIRNSSCKENTQKNI